jgi:hypothetical protein
MLGHADGGQDRVHRKDHVQQQDLDDCRAEAQRGAAGIEDIVSRLRINIVVNFLGRFPD